MSYTFYFKHEFSLGWSKRKQVIGHQLDEKTDTMTIFYQNGGLETFRNWKNYRLKLKGDFGFFMKEKTEKEKLKVVT